MARRRRSGPAGVEPLDPRRKWRAITVATLLLTPAYWSLLTGLVAEGSDKQNAPLAAPYIALGVILLPFVFLALAVLSAHPQAPAATAKALVLAVVIGVPVLGFTGDGVTGLVAGVGAGGIVVLRPDLAHSTKTRALAVAAVTVYTFVTLHTVTVAGLLLAPVLPFTSIGVADHLSERRKARAAL